MPLPTFSEDDVTNFAVAEALVQRDLAEQREQADKDEKTAWKKQGIPKNATAPLGR